MLQCVAVCCSVLQYVAVCCSVLQYVAVCCSVLQYAAYCSVLQCVAVHMYENHVNVYIIDCKVSNDNWILCCSDLQIILQHVAKFN